MSDTRLSTFVEKSLWSGAELGQVRQQLEEAKWPKDEIESALGAWTVVNGVPVPKRRMSLAAGDTFVYMLMFATFFMGAGGLLDVLFGFINSTVPPLDGYANYDIKYGVATLIVSFPVYAFLYAKTARLAQGDSDHRSSAARRWLIYLTLLVSAVATITGIISIVVGLLEGRGDTNGGLKLATMVTLAGATFMNYLWELRRSGSKPGALRRIFMTVATFFILGTIVSGISFSLKHRAPPPQYIQVQPGMTVTYSDGSTIKGPPQDTSSGGSKPTKEPPPAPLKTAP